MPIRSLQFTDAGPFDDIEFRFDEHVNVFAGPNNCGKTTALLVLSDIAVYPFEFPDKLLRSGKPQFRMRFGMEGESVKSLKGQLPISNENEYWTDQRFANHQKAIKLLGCAAFIPTLRWSTDFRSAGPVSGRKRRDETLVSEFLEDSGERQVLPSGRVGRRRRSGPNASIVRDDDVIQDMIELDYRAYREEDPSIRRFVDKIGAITSEITEGFPVEFLGFEEDEKGLYPNFRTPDGDMPLNVLSQGTQSLIQWIGRLVIEYGKFYDYPKSLVDKPGVLIIDEMERL